MYSENLFTNSDQIESNAPLADKLRPNKLDDFFGQESILNERTDYITRNYQNPNNQIIKNSHQPFCICLS